MTPAADIERIYRSLMRIRRVEEEIARVYPTDVIKSPVHLSIGQEAAAVGACDALAPGDVVFGTYRGHAMYLAKGGDLRAMIAELFGRATGCARGKGGSMHLVDPGAGVMGTSAVVGTTIPNAAGHALAMKLRKTGAVTLCFLGDGATEEGVFWETLNFAALKRLPLVLFCENNLYAIHTRQEARQANTDLVGRVRAFGLESDRIAGDDVFAIRDRTAAAVASCRAGSGPVFLECLTYRWREHVGPNEDYSLGYRGREEAAPWVKNDAVARTAGLVAPERRAAIDVEIEEEIREAFGFAEASPWPAADELTADLFGGGSR